MTPAAAVAAAIVTALALTPIALLPHSSQPLHVGRPGDAQSLSGFSRPSTYLGAAGRWTRGEGTIGLPATPIAAVAIVTVAPPEPRATDTIGILVNGVRAHTRTLAAGWNDVAVPIDPRFASTGIELRLRSAVTTMEGDGETRGLFVQRVTLHTGGVRLLRAGPPSAALRLFLAWLGTIALIWQIARPRVRPRAGTDDTDGTSRSAIPVERRRAARAQAIVAGVLLLLALVGVVVFRTPILSHLTAFAILAWASALVAWFANWLTRSLPAPAGETAADEQVAGTGATARTPVPRLRRTWDPAVLAFALCAIALIALLFPDALRRGHVLSQADMFYAYPPWRAHVPADYRAPDRAPLGDVPMLVYPFTSFAQTRLRHGVFPLWTSAISAGQPFLGTYQSALLSPFTLLAVLVPLPHATMAIAVSRLFVGGLGMFLFLRSIGLSRFAAGFGGITYLLNPFTIVWLEHPLAGVPPWLPWMLLAAERLASRTAAAVASAASPARWPWGAVAGLAFATALTLAGGHPHTGLFVAMLGGGYAAARAAAVGRPSEWAARSKAIVLAGVGLGMGVALVALQVLPFLEYVSLSRAAAARAEYALNPFVAPASTLITAVVPNFLGHHASGNFAGPTNYLEQMIYPGIATWMLAALGLQAGVRHWRTWFFAASASLALLVMYGAPGVHQVVSSLPLIRAASLPRVGIVAIAALTVLAALGADVLLHERAPRHGVRPWPATIVLVLAASTLATIALATLRARAGWLAELGLLDFTTRWTWLAVWLTAVTTSIALVRIWNLTGRAAAGVALTGVAALDLLLVGRGFHPLIPSSQVFPLVPEIRRVQQDRELFRVLGAGGALMPNAAMVYGLQDVRGYDGLLVARYADLLDAAFRYEHHTHLADNLRSPLIDLLNVKYVFGSPPIAAPEGWFTTIIDGDAPLYRNNRVLPRAFLVDGCVVQDGNAARRTLRDGRVDFRRVALVEQPLAPEQHPVPAAAPDQVGRATIESYEDHRVELRTDAPDRRLLVLTDVHYPGWEATIDGRPTPIIRANFAFRAVSVPGGRHTVVFTYRPASFRLGLAISGSALLLLAALVTVERRPWSSPGRLATTHADARPPHA